MYPDFIVIGAQKAGTTWLYRNLQNHPQIYLPPEKEIHFFDFPPLIPFYFLLFSPERSIRNWGKNRMLRDYRKVKTGDQSLSWYLRYYFMFRTKRWYRSLFRSDAEQVTGEITPRYSTLKKEGVKRVYSLMPKAKVVYILRNPIERMWSDLAMYHRPQFGHGKLNVLDKKRILKFLKNSQHLAHSHYLSNLSRWEQHYSPSQIFVGFQDQIREEPDILLNSISQFLGVDDFNYHHSELIKKKINSHSYPPIPDFYAKILAEIFIDEIEQIHRRFDNSYSKERLESAQNILQQG